MRGASVDVSVIGVSPFLCCSAQTEEGKNGHDNHDETDEVNDAVHNFLHEMQRYLDKRQMQRYLDKRRAVPINIERPMPL
jgi:hypothetical protein